MIKKLEILLISENQNLKKALQEKLESLGQKIVLIQDKESLLAFLEKRAYPLIFLDWEPKKSKEDILKLIKEKSPCSEIVILLPSSYDFFKVKKILQGGIFDCVREPFYKEDLLLLLERFYKFSNKKVSLLNKGKNCEEFLTSKLIGKSKAIEELRERIKIIAETDLPVLIYGETGVGKELVADLIYELSFRNKGPYIKINCAAIPETLIEGELFGFEKGAFTGAFQSKKGKIELARGGTLLLDEIGDLPIEVQPKFLRVLETKSFYPLGATKEIRVDCRFLFITNKNLKELVEKGKFREDLYYRVNTVSLKIPPLRERREDLPPLIEYFLNYYAEKYEKTPIEISSSAYLRLLQYPYPGNVRELKHLIERAVLLCQNNRIELKDLPEELCPIIQDLSQKELKKCKELLEREIIFQVLKECKGKKGEAAKRLGISRKTLWQKLNTFNI